MENKEKKYTTAFIGITLSGEVYIIHQYKGTSLADCAKWRLNHREEFERIYGEEIREITIKHKR